MKAIKGRHFRITSMQNKIKKAIDIAANGAVVDFDLSASTYETMPPEFSVKKSKGGMVALVTPERDKAGQIWSWNNRGTKVRYATMDEKFRPKTRPNVLRPTRGAGPREPLFVDTSRPQPGIKPRLWTTIVAENRGKKMQKDILSGVRTL